MSAGDDKDKRVRECWERGAIKTAEKLLKKGASLDFPDANGKTLLHRAAEGISINEIELLIRWGASLRAKDNKGFEPLHYAATHRYRKIAQFLIKEGAPLESRDNNGMTPLHIAASDYEGEWVSDILLEAGADPKAQDNLGVEPIMMAARSASAKTVEALLRAGIDPNEPGPDGMTPLMSLAVSKEARAMKKGAGVAKALIEAGADPLARTSAGKGAADFARVSGNLALLAYLESFELESVVLKSGKSPQRSPRRWM